MLERGLVEDKNVRQGGADEVEDHAKDPRNEEKTQELSVQVVSRQRASIGPVRRLEIDVSRGGLVHVFLGWRLSSHLTHA